MQACTPILLTTNRAFKDSWQACTRFARAKLWLPPLFTNMLVMVALFSGSRPPHSRAEQLYVKVSSAWHWSQTARKLRHAKCRACRAPCATILKSRVHHCVKIVLHWVYVCVRVYLSVCCNGHVNLECVALRQPQFLLCPLLLRSRLSFSCLGCFLEHISLLSPSIGFKGLFS